MIKKIFLNPDENRLRTGWRLFLFIPAVPIIMRILNLALKPVFGRLLENNTISWTFRGILVIIGGTLVVWIFRKFIDKKSFVSLGLKFDRLAIWDMSSWHSECWRSRKLVGLAVDFHRFWKSSCCFLELDWLPAILKS